MQNKRCRCYDDRNNLFHIISNLFALDSPFDDDATDAYASISFYLLLECPNETIDKHKCCYGFLSFYIRYIGRVKASTKLLVSFDLFLLQQIGSFPVIGI